MHKALQSEEGEVNSKVQCASIHQGGGFGRIGYAWTFQQLMDYWGCRVNVNHRAQGVERIHFDVLVGSSPS